jgi:hypothetical protein
MSAVFANRTQPINITINNNYGLPHGANTGNTHLGNLLGHRDVTLADGTHFSIDQPAGPGGDLDITAESPSGLKVSITMHMGADHQLSLGKISIDGIGTTSEQQVGVANLLSSAMGSSASSGGDGLKSFVQLMMDIAQKQKNKKEGGGSAADGADGATGDLGDLGVTDVAENWFMVLAEALGTVLNKLGKNLSDLVRDVKLGKDGQPPYKDAMKIQALAQELAFISQALMTALNSIGESIKSTVTAGGAAR